VANLFSHFWCVNLLRFFPEASKLCSAIYIMAFVLLTDASEDYISQFGLLRRSNSNKFEASDAVPAEESVVADPFSSTISAITQSMFISPIRWRYCLSNLMPTVVLVPAF
jgi:hypothetical protein